MGQRFLAAASTAIAAGWLAACGGHVARGTGSGATGSGGTASTTGSGGVPCALATPPPPGPAQAPGGTGTVTFAMTKLYLGDTDPDGTPDMALGWTHYGYDIDGVPPGQTDAFCKPSYGAKSAWIHPPGCNGVENAFGRSIVPILVGINSNLSTQVDAHLAAGGPTILISLTGLGPGTNAGPLPSQIAMGGDLLSTPKYDGTDAWPVLGGTETPLASGYLVEDTWVSGPSAAITITLPLLPSLTPLRLDLRHAVVTMKLDPAHRKATGGTISGVLSSADLAKQIAMLALSFDPSCCSGECGGIATELMQASDILQDGTQDPTHECDGISVGLGFDATLVQLGPTSPPPDAGPYNPCAMDGG